MAGSDETTDKSRGGGSSGRGTGKILAVALLAALAGFAAVYVTVGPNDNVSSAPPAGGEAKSGSAATPDAGHGDLVGYVDRPVPLDMPEVRFKDETGADMTLAAFKGKTVLLNLWATWCAPCRKEMPSLDRLQAALGSDKFEVVALSLDRAGVEAARKFYDEIGVKSLKLYIDSTMRAGNSLKAVGMPTTILIDAEGRERGRLPGPAEWDSAEAKEIIAKVMR